MHESGAGTVLPHAMHARRGPATAPARIRVGALPIDSVSMDEALARIGELVVLGDGGAVFTPNVDHIVRAQRDSEFAATYDGADLSLADGQPVVWASRLLGTPLPSRVAGSDIVIPVLELAAARGWSVYFLGGAPGAADEAARRAASTYGVSVAGASGPMVAARPGVSDIGAALAPVVQAAPDLLFVGFGSPKGEMFVQAARAALGPTVSLSIGAAIDFLAGAVPRAPRWMAGAGLEWSYRLAREPRRLWRRYLVDDPRFVRIVAAEAWARKRPAA